jgi:hypothetical protein
MTLEEQLDQAIKPWVSGGARRPAAEAAAMLAKSLILKAWRAGFSRSLMEANIEIPEVESVDDNVFPPTAEDWLKASEL